MPVKEEELHLSLVPGPLKYSLSCLLFGLEISRGWKNYFSVTVDVLAEDSAVSFL